jgi:hypothetical protein
VPTSFTDVQGWLIILGLLLACVALLIAYALGLGRRRPPRQQVSVDEAMRRDLAEIRTRLESLEGTVGRVAESLPRSIQGVGVVRYNPFPEVGGSMSFSLALLDGRANGVVVSVLTNRDGSRVYGKAVENGDSSYPLSDEERQALALARNNRR